MATADGSGPAQLTHSPGGIQGTPRWSPDGRRLAFDSYGREGTDIYTIDATGVDSRRLTSAPSVECQPSWSRDGQWIYFQSNRPRTPSERTGQLEIWRCPYPAGAFDRWQQMTTGGGDVAFESTDGRTLYYTNRDGELFAKRLAGGAAEKLIDKVTRGFAVVDKGIFYFGAPGRDNKVPPSFYQFTSRAIRELARIPNAGGNAGLTVSRDGKTFLYSQSVYTGRDLMLIENFR